MRKRLGTKRRISDTTLRDALSTIEHQEPSPILHPASRSAHRSKSISVDFELPFDAVSMDGKCFTVRSVDDQCSQLVDAKWGGRSHWYDDRSLVQF